MSNFYLTIFIITIFIIVFTIFIIIIKFMKVIKRFHGYINVQISSRLLYILTYIFHICNSCYKHHLVHVLHSYVIG